MAITTEVRGDILELLVMMFDAAPGAQYLSEITALYESIPGTHAQKMASLAGSLSTTAAFQTLHPNFQTANEFATDFLSTVELEGNAEARAWVVANFGTGSYAQKAAIMQAGWTFLNSYTGTVPEFLKAKEIMLNKAEVSEHFSVTMGGNATGTTLEEIMASLQDVVAHVDETQESVDAAIDEIDDDLAVGPTLTPGNDIIDVQGTAATNIEGIVDGDADDSTAASTFNPGDNITGNGNTNLNLVVVEGGDAGFTRLEDIEAVNIEAGTDATITFNAGGWTDVGSVNLNSGADGLFVILNNLEAETEVSVSDITGAILANYDTDGGDLGLLIINNDEGSTGITGVATFEGDVTITGADEASAFISNTTGVELGTVDVTLGNESYFSMYFSDEGPSVGEVTVVQGNESTFNFSAVDISGDVSVGGISATLGDTADLEVSFSEIFGGDVTVGDVSLTAGDGMSEIDVYVTEVESGDVTFGDISAMAGTGADVNATFEGEDTALVVGNVALEVGAVADGEDDDADAFVNLNVDSWSSVDFGDVSLTAGDGGFVDVSFSWNGAVDLGSVNLMAGASGYITMGVYETAGDTTIASIDAEGGIYTDVLVWITNSGTSYGSDVTVGDVSLIAGASAYAHFTVEDHLNTTIGNVTMMAGTSVDMYVEGEGDMASITVGNIDVDVTAETGGYVSVSIDNYLDGEDEFNAGSVTVGDVDISNAGDDASVDFYVWNAAFDAPTEDATNDTVGNLTVGDVTIEVGSNTALDTTADISMTISQTAGSYTAGDVTVGDVTLTVGDGFASGTVTNEANITAYIYNYGEDVGNMTVGNVSTTVGDFASSYLSISLSASGDAGNMTVGDISMDGGESSALSAYVFQWAEGTIGDFTVGNIDVDAAQDSYAYVSLSSSAGAEAVSAGDFTVGNVDITMGDNAMAYLEINQWINYATDTEEDLVGGDFTVGNVSIAVSATETEDLSGGSYILAYISNSWEDMTGFDSGNFTVGDVSLSAAGDDAVFDLYIANYVGADTQGDMNVGTVSITAGDGASIGTYATISISNSATGASTGSLTVEGITIDVGADSDIDFNVEVNTAGDIGDIALGDQTVVAGDDSNVRVDLVHATAEAGDFGDFSVGDVDITAGEGATVYFTGFDLTKGGDVGDVSVGDFDATLDASATVSFSVSVSAVDVGAVTAGDIVADVGESSNFLYGLYINAETIGGTTVGDVDVSVTDGGMATVTIGAWATGGSAGDVTVGDVMLTSGDEGATTGPAETPVALGGSIYMLISHSGDPADAMTVGDVTLAVEGTDADDYVRMDIISNDGADVTIGDISVSGEGLFFIDNAQHTGDNESYIYVETTGTITIGDVDFSGYENDIELDLDWTDAGAANISAGSGDDTIMGNAGNNVISGGEGADEIDITSGGDDTIVTSEGDSGVTLATMDTITGFDGDDSPAGAADGDKLDFNLVAGTAGNYVEDISGADTLADFIDDANDTLNSTVKYYADYISSLGVTLVAVNYGSGEADLIVALTGNQLADLTFGNFIA